MRRKDREMDKEFALEMADKCEYAVLSMAEPDLTPYCVPLSIVRDGGFIYFHCAKAGKKSDILKKNPKVCISCVGDTHRMENKFTTEYESAIIFGTAQEVSEDEEKIHALKILCERHTPMNMAEFDEAIKRSLSVTAIWRVSIDEITGKRKKYDKEGIEMKYGRMK